MKAVIYDKKARPDKLVFCDIEKPIPGDNEVLIKVIAVSLNAADYRSMKMGMIPKKKIFGADVAGIVESVGKNIRQFKSGDEVFGELAGYGFGGLAEYALGPENLLALKPAGISFEEAAALPMASITALQALRNKGNIREGQEVLIIGTGGGVGTFAVQLARHFGGIVTGVCSNRNIKQTQLLGADHVIDYTRKNFLQSKNKYDIILAVNGNYSLLACRRMLKPNGIYVMVGGTLSQIFNSILFGWALSLGSRKIRFLTAKPTREELELIGKLAEEGRIRPVIDRSFPLEKTAEAFNCLIEGRATGKVLVKVVDN